MKKPKIEKPAIGSSRKEIPGPFSLNGLPEIKEVIVEQRGIRTCPIPVFGGSLSLQTLQAAAALDGGANSVLEILLREANSVLRDANEQSFSSAKAEADRTRAKLQKSKAPSAAEKQALDIVTLRSTWVAGIAARKGLLSPEAIAAKFLSIYEIMNRSLPNDPILKSVILEFADCWHWLHFEVFNKHQLATFGAAASAGLKAGPRAKARVKARKLVILEEEFRNFAAVPKNAETIKSAKRTAPALKETVNERLSLEKLDTFTTAGLEKAVRPFQKPFSSRRARRTGQSRKQVDS
jgi:hypothetical protein